MSKWERPIIKWEKKDHHPIVGYGNHIGNSLEKLRFF